jgi:ATP-dependent Clp protease adapter protein ClpS
MEFVIQVLQQFFDKTEESAYAIMLKVHIDGDPKTFTLLFYVVLFLVLY